MAQVLEMRDSIDSGTERASLREGLENNRSEFLAPARGDIGPALERKESDLLLDEWRSAGSPDVGARAVASGSGKRRGAGRGCSTIPVGWPTRSAIGTRAGWPATLRVNRSGGDTTRQFRPHSSLSMTFQTPIGHLGARFYGERFYTVAELFETPAHHFATHTASMIAR